MYVEVITGDIHKRDINAEIKHFSDVQYESCDTERYTSLFQYDEGIKNHFELVGSVKGYSGVLYMDRLWIDLDNKQDPSLAKEETNKLINKLVLQFEVPKNAISIFFSGHKGYHLALHENLFGGFEPSSDLPKKIKALVEGLCGGIDFIDYGIYNVNRAFRALNSCHPETSLYKIGITYEDFTSLSHEEIMYLAAEPTEGYIFTTDMQPKNSIKKLADLWKFVSSVTIQDFRQEYGIEVPTDDFWGIAAEGERNTKLFKQACFLFEKSTFDFNVVKKLLQNTNLASGNPIPDKELYQLARSAESRVRKEVFDASARSWHTLAEQAGEIVDALEQKAGNYTLLFQDFDDIVMGDLSGKLIVIAGQGGTKKSIYAQQFLTENCRTNNMRGVYNNQEMSKSQFLKRQLNMLPEKQRTKQLWDELKESFAQYAIDKSEATKGLNAILRDPLAKRIIVDYRLAANADYYKHVLEQITKKEGKVDMLIVDGLSMMEDNGKEKESAEKHTKELKYLANEYNIPVIALVHVTKDIPKHFRDLTPFMRGSGKILDNADIFISCSLCIDTEISNDDDVIYREDIGYLRLFDKRETGLTINQVYQFDKKNLKMVKHPTETPQSVEVKMKRKYD
jgi:KaiC/GvpD/RAD55 family RecA-like ATPase